MSEFSLKAVNLNDTDYKKDSSLGNRVLSFAKNFDEKVCLGHAGIFLLAQVFIEQSKVDFIHFAKQIKMLMVAKILKEFRLDHI